MQDALMVVRTACAIGLTGLLLAGCSSKGDPRRTVLGGGVDDSELKLISPEKAQEKILDSFAKGDAMDLIIIDPRPESQWREQRLAGARNVQLADVRQGAMLVPKWEPADLRSAKAENAGEPRSDRLADYDEILIYGTDPASATPYAMAKKLKGFNYTNVYILDGGLFAWRGAGGEVLGTGPAEAESAKTKGAAAEPK
ncbi:MAG TPA: rhodanese-like domain-containing protein [Phycisphaerales bacterium]|nr:rhodanese-like domain-containing protein [Phycisphaerales bacterium]